MITIVWSMIRSVSRKRKGKALNELRRYNILIMIIGVLLLCFSPGVHTISFNLAIVHAYVVCDGETGTAI